MLAQTAAVVGEAATMSGLSLEELVEALTRSPQAAGLMAAALQGSAATAVDAKLKLFARVLANTATDSAVIDEDLLVVRAINALEAPHLRVMELLRREPPATDVPTKRPPQHWTGASVALELGWPASSVTSVLLTLQADRERRSVLSDVEGLKVAAAIYLSPHRLTADRPRGPPPWILEHGSILVTWPAN
jgi:hypothetical protein